MIHEYLKVRILLSKDGKITVERENKLKGSELPPRVTKQLKSAVKFSSNVC